jgi:hypothetical protein
LPNKKGDHAHERLAERYKDLVIDEGFMPRLVEHILVWRSARADDKLLRVRGGQTLQTTVYDVRFERRWFRLVFDDVAKEVVTFYEDPTAEK